MGTGLQTDMFIKRPFYRRIIGVIPILCVDLVIKDRHGHILLVKRKNEPLADHWWTIGGRIWRNEDPKIAAVRLAREEVGQIIKTVKFIGYYNDVFDKSVIDMEGGIHSVSLVFECTCDARTVVLDKQSSDYKWGTVIPPRFLKNLVKV